MSGETRPENSGDETAGDPQEDRAGDRIKRRYDRQEIDMRLNLAELAPDRLAESCRRWDIVRLEVFGSALRDDFGPESDIDFLVTFAPEARRSLFDLIAAEEEWSGLLGRKVDLVTRAGVERSGNWIRRRETLSTARLLYAA